MDESTWIILLEIIHLKNNHRYFNLYPKIRPAVVHFSRRPWLMFQLQKPTTTWGCYFLSNICSDNPVVIVIVFFWGDEFAIFLSHQKLCACFVCKYRDCNAIAGRAQAEELRFRGFRQSQILHEQSKSVSFSRPVFRIYTETCCKIIKLILQLKLFIWPSLGKWELINHVYVPERFLPTRGKFICLF